MYDYILLSESNLCRKFSCRESLIYGYSDYASSNHKQYFYFGHVSYQDGDKITRIYTTLCNEIWKDKVPFEIVKIKDINIYNSYGSQDFEATVEDYPELPLIKISNVFPIDLSLILYMSWYGITDLGNIKRYFAARKYSDLIPNEYQGFMGNGPDSYIYYSTRGNYDLLNKINDVVSSHEDDPRFSNKNTFERLGDY